MYKTIDRNIKYLAPIKSVLLAEYFFGVFRNNAPSTKYLQLLYTSINIFVLCYFNVIAFISSNPLYKKMENAEKIYLMVITTESISIMIFSIFKSKSFACLMSSINKNHVRMGHCDIYNRHLKFLHRRVTISVVVSVLYLIKITIDVLMHSYSDLHGHVHILMTINGCRWFFQNLMYYNVLTILSHQLANLRDNGFKNRNPNFILHRKAKNPTTIEKIEERDVAIPTLSDWYRTYFNIVESSVITNNVFGTPMALSMCTSIFCNVLLAYAIISGSVRDGPNLGRTAAFIFFMTPFLTSLLLISRAGQRLHNNADANVRAVVQLLSRARPENENFATLRQIASATSTHRVSITLFGSVQVGHALLPSAFTMLSNYLITGLQFNNLL